MFTDIIIKEAAAYLSACEGSVTPPSRDKELAEKLFIDAKRLQDYVETLPLSNNEEYFAATQLIDFYLKATARLFSSSSKLFGMIFKSSAVDLQKILNTIESKMTNAYLALPAIKETSSSESCRTLQQLDVAAHFQKRI